MKGFRIMLMAAITLLLIFAVIAIPVSPWADGTSKNFINKILVSTGVRRQIKDVKILLGGDVMLGRTVLTKSLDSGDVRYPFLEIGVFTSQSDLFLVNLENAVINQCPRCLECLSFCTDPEILDGLLYAGVDVVNLANNHSRNFSEEGIIETKEHLKSSNIAYVDHGQLFVKEIESTKFGIIGFNFFDNLPSEEDYNAVRNANSQVDVLIVSVHWGVEYTDNPTESQRQWAQNLVNAGADVIAGHHPHWVQTIEMFDGKPIFYSLGNLVFDQMGSKKTREGMLVELRYRDGVLIDQRELPIFMEEWAQP